MRRLLIVSILLLFAGIACDQTSKTTPVDIETEKAALNEIMDKLDSAVEESDRTVYQSLLTEDALFCGTDPSEFWNKQEFIDLNEQDSSDYNPDFEYIGDREIKVTPDGNSAIVVTQFIIGWSPKKNTIASSISFRQNK